MSSLFGTDGIRGKANCGSMTAEIILNLAQATATHFKNKHNANNGQRFSVVIGKDTRLSGYMIESALMSGFTSVGVDVFMLGPVPTPALAMLTRSLRADLGIMISASHNPYYDNGLKIFDRDGFKLSAEDEKVISEMVERKAFSLAEPLELGKAKRLDDAAGRYIEFAKATFPRGKRLDGLKIVIDCANGAAYNVAPRVLWELGAETIIIGDKPNGLNINEECGATHPTTLAKRVKEEGADLGIALDGDADRVILVDEHGEVLDGDLLLALTAKSMKEQNLLKGKGVVATVMSNMALKDYMESIGLTLHQSAVGDKNVLAMMQEKGCNLGGEQSGHIIFSDYCSTGDGLVAALQVLRIMTQENKPLSAYRDLYTPAHQILKNVHLRTQINFNVSVIQEAISAAQAQLRDSGQLLVRKSGTEPIIRIMAQGFDADLILKTCDGLESFFKKYIEQHAA